MPVPYFDISESPDSVRTLYEQKANWYMGPLQSYEYSAQILKQKEYGGRETVRLYILATKLFLHALCWIAGPTFLMLLFVLSIATFNPWYIAMGVLCSLFFVMVPSFLTYGSIRKIGVPVDDMLTVRQASMALARGSLVAYALHGASAYKGLMRYVRHLWNGREITKQKTVMLHRGQR